ncbi:hypothetical protein NL518_29195, partial [Klebsiella pneumoniae]|nr:hypothetical protein [Klebsiella pneumoniae]
LIFFDILAKIQIFFFKTCLFAINITLDMLKCHMDEFQCLFWVGPDNPCHDGVYGFNVIVQRSFHSYFNFQEKKIVE